MALEPLSVDLWHSQQLVGYIVRGPDALAFATAVLMERGGRCERCSIVPCHHHQELRFSLSSKPTRGRRPKVERVVWIQVDMIRVLHGLNREFEGTMTCSWTPQTQNEKFNPITTKRDSPVLWPVRGVYNLHTKLGAISTIGWVKAAS